jgi:2-polyprenyl-6-methoxyphenol hydroxylase-like FAD-dependent oxidoreductase
VVHHADVVIVGGGIAGGGLAVVLARAGLEVLVLERQAQRRDRVLGEFMPPWGYRELQLTDLLDVVMQAEGTVVTRMVGYDEVVPADVAEATALDVTSVLPGVPGALHLSHPGACEALLGAAADAGARVVRAATEIAVTAGEHPSVRFRHDRDGARCEARSGLVVGADGRSSAVRRQVGIPLHGTGPNTFAAGLLVDGVDGWAEATGTQGTYGDVLFYITPRQNGRTRLYLCWRKDDPGRFAGPHGATRFLDCFGSLRCLPDPEMFRQGVPAGPCASHPFAETWTDRPYVPGVVLVGDAAGYNDPIIGQGLSIAIRDVRLVSQAILESAGWSPSMFAPYAVERAERMRRLRATAEAMTRMRATFTEEGRQRRAAAFARFGDPVARMPIEASLYGPELLPAEAFERQAADRMLAL